MPDQSKHGCCMALQEDRKKEDVYCTRAFVHFECLNLLAL